MKTVTTFLVIIFPDLWISSILFFSSIRQRRRENKMALHEETFSFATLSASLMLCLAGAKYFLHYFAFLRVEASTAKAQCLNSCFKETKKMLIFFFHFQKRSFLTRQKKKQQTNYKKNINRLNREERFHNYLPLV